MQAIPTDMPFYGCRFVLCTQQPKKGYGNGVNDDNDDGRAPLSTHTIILYTQRNTEI